MISPLGRRTTVVALAALMLAGCSVFTDATEQPRVSLDVQPTGDANVMAPSVDIVDGGVTLYGIIDTPCSGYNVSANVDQSANAMVLTLRARQVSAGCYTAIHRYLYTATVSGVSAGVRRVTVRHVIENSNWSVRTVLDTTVTVR